MLKQKPKTFAVSSVFSVFLFTATNAFSTPNIEGEWLNRSKDFSLVVWIMGPVVCGYLAKPGGEMAEETIRSLLAVWASVRLKLHTIVRTQKAAERHYYLLSAVNSIGMS
jgi:hypothetical protein